MNYPSNFRRAVLGYKLVPMVIFQRAAHGDASNLGQTASEYEPKGKAAQEMDALYTYIISKL